MLNGLDLFSGIGGITVALAPWVRPVAYCEKDRFAQGVLLSRQADGSIPFAPIWDDVCTLSGSELPSVDMVYGGFPCQDISTAGDGAGLAGERSGLVFELFRIVRECRPEFIFLENVPALAVRGLDRLLLELNAMGFDARWTVVSAEEVGAPHLRERIWILAHANGHALRLEPEPKRGGCRAPQSRRDGGQGSMANFNGEREPQQSRGIPELGGRVIDRGKDVADSDSEGLEVGQQGDSREFQAAFRRSWWESEPDVGRVAHGVPLRVDRLKGLGNSVVPASAREAFMRLMGIHDVSVHVTSENKEK